MDRSCQLSILRPSASTIFNKDGIAILAAHSHMSSAAVSKDHYSTKSSWCLYSLTRASQMGGEILGVSHLYQV